jgi:heat shock protein HspQ
MSDLQQIPFLIRLLDDDSEEIRGSVFKRLEAFGPNLKAAIPKLPFPLNSRQRFYLDLILQGQKKVRLRQMWSSWFSIKNDDEKLEEALSVLSDFLSSGFQSPRLTSMLNSLAFSYRVKHRQKDHRALLDFLFGSGDVEIQPTDYENPQACNLAYVIKNRRGIPVSLATLYVLIGRRLGLNWWSRSFYQSFLERMAFKEELSLMDSSGASVPMESSGFQEEILVGGVEEEIDGVFSRKMDAEVVVRVYLSSLVRAYQIHSDDTEGLIIDLFKDLEFWNDHRQVMNATPEQIISMPSKLFSSGDVIQHLRYDYNGIVVAIDAECQATDAWYYANPTQPPRRQPWVHLLVDQTSHVSYVPQSDLRLAEAVSKIEHPLLHYFFKRSAQGSYFRNDNPWPETNF